MANQCAAVKNRDPNENNGRQRYQDVGAKPVCNVHIEELAKPKKRSVRYVYVDYKPVLPNRNRIIISEYLREEFAKSAEETADIFKKLSEKSRLKKCKKRCQIAARLQQLSTKNHKDCKYMMKLLRALLRRFMTRAYFNPKQIIMTNRLRGISNQVLVQLCELRRIRIPDRQAKSIRASLMYSISEFFGFCIDCIYYELEVQKVKDYEALKSRQNTPISYKTQTPESYNT